MTTVRHWKGSGEVRVRVRVGGGTRREFLCHFFACLEDGRHVHPKTVEGPWSNGDAMIR